MEGLYKEIYDKLNKEVYKSILKTIYIDDLSKQFEDVVSDIYIDVLEDTISFEQIDVNYLKAYSKKNYHKHGCIYDDVNYINPLDVDNELSIIPDSRIEHFKNLNLTDEEELVILYCLDKRNFKCYDYSFVKRNNSRGVDHNKISKYYEVIINKLLTKIKKEGSEL